MMSYLSSTVFSSKPPSLLQLEAYSSPSESYTIPESPIGHLKAQVLLSIDGQTVGHDGKATGATAGILCGGLAG